MSIAKIRCWPPSFLAQPERYIIQRKEGLIQVILVILNGGETKVCAASALFAISLEKAWYTLTVSGPNEARISLSGDVISTSLPS